jgi:allantoinase
MKQLEKGHFGWAWGGIAGLATALPVLWTEAQRRGFDLTDIARWMAEKPAQLAGCAGRKGQIARGCDADFVVFDADAEFEVTAAGLPYRHKLSPYLGERLRGVVRRTYLRGQLVYRDGEFPGEPAFPGNPRGRELSSAAGTMTSETGMR